MLGEKRRWGGRAAASSCNGVFYADRQSGRRHRVRDGAGSAVASIVAAACVKNIHLVKAVLRASAVKRLKGIKRERGGMVR